MELTGAQALVKSLEMQEVEVIFGLPGGAILPVYDPIIDSPIRHILVRHEQGAGHMAEGYAQATGRPGVAMVTSGPGATNVVTPLADAYMDSIPFVVHHRAGVHERHRDRRLPRERHDRASPSGVTKHNWLVTDAADIPQVVARGVPRRHHRPSRARADRRPEGRRQLHHGVVLARRRRPARLPPAVAARSRGDRGRGRAHAAAERPVIYAGGGILKSGASAALRELAELTRHPRRDDAHGPRRRSPTAIRCASACRACTATTPQ